MLGTIWQIYCSLNLQLVFVFCIRIQHQICTKQVIRGQNQWHRYLSKVCLKKGGTDRRMKVHDELLYVGGFTDEEIVKFGKIITANCHKTLFFSHPGHISRSCICTACFKRGFMLRFTYF